MIQTTIVAIHRHTSKYCLSCLSTILIVKMLTKMATLQGWPQWDESQMALISIKISTMTLLAWVKFVYQILMNSTVPFVKVVKILIITVQPMLKWLANKLNLDHFPGQMLERKSTRRKLITKTSPTYFIISIKITRLLAKKKKKNYDFCSQSSLCWLKCKWIMINKKQLLPLRPSVPSNSLQIDTSFNK